MDVAFRRDGGVFVSDGGVSLFKPGRLLPTNELSSQHKRPVLPLSEGHLTNKKQEELKQNPIDNIFLCGSLPGWSILVIGI